MSKIIQAVNAMLEKKDKISDVIRGADEYFFLFNKKYKWSIKCDEKEENYWLYFYPGNISLRDLAHLAEAGAWGDYSEIMAYSSAGLGTKEAYQTFRDLYATVKEKIFGIDKILDDIIAEEKPS